MGVLEGLFGVDSNGAVQPKLVSDWSRSDGDTRWEFTLRDDVTLHDGSALGADAVVFSLERAFSTSGSRLSGLPIDAVEAADDRTVAVTTSEPLASLPGQLTRPPAGIISPDSANGDGEVESAIATGPFQVDSWQPDSQLAVTKHDGYHGTVPTLERAVLERVQDPQTRMLKLQNDELALATNLPSSEASTLGHESGLTLHRNEGPGTQILVFNTDRQPLSDRRVRQAMLYAIDRNAIVDSVLEGIGSPAHAPWDSERIDWSADDLQTYEHDAEQAATLLSEAGWEQDGDVRRKDGQDLQITLWTYNDRPTLSDVVTVLQSQLGTVGFDIEVRVTEWGALNEAKQNGDFDVFAGFWTFYRSPPDPDTLTNFYHSEQNILDSPYQNAEVDELLESGRTTFDESERAEMYNEVQEIVMTDVPVGFLTRQTKVNGTQSSVTGYDPNPITFDQGLQDISR
ncbi:ABC transporter substrate-binding protein [Haloarcula sp. S1CR25-12]|uniref:ABC transporter substrate-binding protein n=1 Tax=Haloarcula saliterrae TaxID=2950534 RepID=A0ABU2FFH5_9EURY|nr:ABC transporter substrate-binding protein [Haloarcula sp. S1CR25-12]MDS0260989.1 ABC transporter substrate-binding protein [Haloarcula sp. S1CR25-12]